MAALTELARGRRRVAVSPWGLTIAAVAVAGIALRVWVYRSALGVPNSDEAVVGLMARHFLHGEFTTFYWGQAYGGPQEAMLAVPGFAVFGSSWLALRLVPLVLSAVGAILVWRVGLRTIGPRGALVAGALLWIWPPYVVDELTHELGFYGLDVVYSALLLLLALRAVERPDAVRVGLLGLVLGLAFWETSQIVPIAAAVIVWTVWKEPKTLRQLPVAVALGLLGAAPWLVWNLTHHWGSLHIAAAVQTSYAHRLRLLVSPLLPMMLGIRTPLSQANLLPLHLGDLVYLLLVAAFIWGLIRYRRTERSVLYGALLLFPFLYATAAQAFVPDDPRYLVVLAPVLALLLAQTLTTWPRAVIALAVLGALTAVTLHRMEPYPMEQTDGVPTAPRNIQPLVATLDRLGISRVYTTYWLAYVLDFDTKERITGVETKFDVVRFAHGQVVLPHQPWTRQPQYMRRVESGPRAVVLFRAEDDYPAVPAMEQHGFRRIVVGPFEVFVPPAT